MIEIEGAWDTVIRTLVGFVVLFILTRLAGKKQLGQMTFFTYITGIALGNMAGDMIIHKDVAITDGLIGMALWSVLILVLELVSLHWHKARAVLDGEPSIVIKNGVIQSKELKKIKLNIDDLTMLLRMKDIFSIKDVRFAVFEPHGELSVVKKAALQAAAKQDLGLTPAENPYMPGELISDGHIVLKNLKEFGLGEEWLKKELRKQNITAYRDVFYAELEEDGTLFVQKKER